MKHNLLSSPTSKVGMKIRRVVAAPAPTMEMEEEAKTTSLLDKETSPALSSPNHRRPDELATEVTWTWKRQSSQGLRPKIKLHCRKKVLEDIQSVLTAFGGKSLLQQFCDGCFGHLMHFVGGNSCNKALHEFMSREINLPGARGDELWFHISRTNIRFSPAEYALVTGLRFGSSSFDPLGGHKTLPDGVFKRFCSGHPITIKELWKRFNSQSVRGSAEDYLKVAHVLALYLMALGYDYGKIIEEWVWVLVEDLDLWNIFPWGAYTYQALIHFASILPKTKAVLGSYYEFSGPVWALQIWAYESIPQLGNICASVTGQVTIPRCCKWSFLSTNMSFTHFFEQELVCSVTLDPTNEEQLQAYWVSVQTPRPLGVRYNPPQRRKAAANRAKDPVPSDDTSSTDGSRDCPRQKRTRESIRPRPETFDESRFMDQVSSRVINHLPQQLIPQMKQRMDDLSQQLILQMKLWMDDLSQQLILQMKQWIDDLYRRVHDQLETMRAEKNLYAKPPGFNAESAKAAEIAEEIIKKEHSLDRSSSSMLFSRNSENGHPLGENTEPVLNDAFCNKERLEVLKNALRLDTGVAGWAKPFSNKESGLNGDCPLTVGRSQIGSRSCEPLKWELKHVPCTVLPPGGILGGAGTINPFSSRTRKKKHRRSPSSTEETSDDEGSEESRRRRKLKKKRCKRKKPKYTESSPSESDRHRRKRKRHKCRCSSSDSDAQDHHPLRQQQHYSVSLPDWFNFSH